jgi:hypothetical protein
MLLVAAFQVGDPVRTLVQMEANNLAGRAG